VNRDDAAAVAMSPGRQATAAAAAAITINTYGVIAGLTVGGIIHITSGCIAAATATATAIILMRAGLGDRIKPAATLCDARRNADDCHPAAPTLQALFNTRAGVLEANDARTWSNSRVIALRSESHPPYR
jgi:hypothetical protein